MNTVQGENHRGRKCIVVGASYGIGRATADILASRGAHVVYASRSNDKLLKATRLKANCYPVVMDASNPESVRDGINDALTLLGSLDLVVYCPGYFGPDSYGSFERLFDSGDWDAGWKGSMDLHVNGMMNSFRHTRKALLQSKRGGVFIGLSSIAGAMGHPGAAQYAICKAAVDMSLKQLALEYAPKGLRVLSVAPGLVKTPAIENLGADTETFLEQVGASHPMKRYAQPREVGELIAFLASERASFMTGGPIYVDGGAMLNFSLSVAIRPFFDERSTEPAMADNAINTVGCEKKVVADENKVDGEELVVIHQ